MIGLYRGHVFQGTSRIWQETRIVFLGKWEGSNEDFFKIYHRDFPNEKLQIYLHKYKPLSRQFRVNIEQYMKTDPYFIQLNRDEQINNLLT